MQLTKDQVGALIILERRIEEANVKVVALNLAMETLKETGITADVAMRFRDGVEQFEIDELTMVIPITADMYKLPKAFPVDKPVDMPVAVCFACDNSPCICSISEPLKGA